MCFICTKAQRICLVSAALEQQGPSGNAATQAQETNGLWHSGYLYCARWAWNFSRWDKKDDGQLTTNSCSRFIICSAHPSVSQSPADSWVSSRKPFSKQQTKTDRFRLQAPPRLCSSFTLCLRFMDATQTHSLKEWSKPFSSCRKCVLKLFPFWDQFSNTRMQVNNFVQINSIKSFGVRG